MIKLWSSAATFLLATSAGAQTPPAFPPVQIAGPVLTVADLQRSLTFYHEALGLVVGNHLPGPGAPGAMVTGDGGKTPFILLRQRYEAASPPFQVGDGLSRIMLIVADSREAAARLDAKGYAHTALNDRNVFFVTDPDGYRFEVIQRAPNR